jgi:hypothetical protein
MMLYVFVQETAERLAEVQQGIGPLALTFMVISMGAVTLLTAWCFFRILGGRRHFDPDGTGPAHAPVPGELDRKGPSTRQ